MRMWMGLFFVLFVGGAIYADTVHLKNGRSISDAEVISEGDTVSLRVHGTTINIPSGQIDRIEKQAISRPKLPDIPKRQRFANTPKPESTPLASSPKLRAIQDCRFVLKDQGRGFTDSCAEALEVIEKLYVGEAISPDQIKYAYKYIKNPMMWNALNRTQCSNAKKLKEFFDDPDSKIQTKLKNFKAQYEFEAEQERERKRGEVRQARINAREMGVKRFYKTSHSGRLPVYADVLNDDPRFAWFIQKDSGYRIAKALARQVSEAKVSRVQSQEVSDSSHAQDGGSVSEFDDFDIPELPSDLTTDTRFEWCVCCAGKYIYSEWVTFAQSVYFEYLMQAPKSQRIVMLENGGIVLVNGNQYRLVSPKDVNGAYAKWKAQSNDPRYHHPLHMHPKVANHGHFSVPPWEKSHYHTEPLPAGEEPWSLAELNSNPKYVKYWDDYLREIREAQRQQQYLDELKQHNAQLQNEALSQQRQMLKKDRDEREKTWRQHEARQKY